MKTVRLDRYHIPMEDISPFPLERSEDGIEWEDASHEELDQILDTLPEEKVKTFLSVVRNGGVGKLEGYFYRIQPH